MEVTELAREIVEEIASKDLENRIAAYLLGKRIEVNHDTIERALRDRATALGQDTLAVWQVMDVLRRVLP